MDPLIESTSTKLSNPAPIGARRLRGTTATVALMLAGLVLGGSLATTSPATATGGGGQVAPTAPVAVTANELAAKPKKGNQGSKGGKKSGRWSGYRIRKNGTASGGWIGGRKLDGQIVYRIDPGAKPKNGHYLAATPTGDAGAKATPEQTAQAAYVLSKYGSFKYEVQAAAVDVALTHLLAGKKWAIKGSKSRHRVAQTDQPSKVRSFARAMLKDAAASAGAPALGLAVNNSPVGGTVRATVTLRDAAGKPMADENVRVDYPGQSSQVVRTDSGGTGVATFTATQAGRQTLTATVDKLASWDLLVMNPVTKTSTKSSGTATAMRDKPGKGGKKHHKKGTASRVAVAGVKSSRTATAVTTVGVQPTIGVTAPGRSLLSSPVPGQFVISAGEPGERTATVYLHGPYSTAAASNCGGGVASSGAMSVPGNGTYSIPAMTVPAAGFYSIGVALDGDAVNAPASGCGGVIALQTQPAVSIEKGNDPIPVGDFIRAKVTVAGLPGNQSYGNNAQVQVYGPYADKDNVTCGAGKEFKRSSAYVNGNGASWMDPVPVGQDGFFALVVTLPDGTFSTAAGSACGANGTIVKVQ